MPVKFRKFRRFHVPELSSFWNEIIKFSTSKICTDRAAFTMKNRGYEISKNAIVLLRCYLLTGLS